MGSPPFRPVRYETRADHNDYSDADIDDGSQTAAVEENPRAVELRELAQSSATKAVCPRV